MGEASLVGLRTRALLSLYTRLRPSGRTWILAPRPYWSAHRYKLHTFTPNPAMQSLGAKSPEAGVRKRKVRKGTHSCWECKSASPSQSSPHSRLIPPPGPGPTSPSRTNTPQAAAARPAATSTPSPTPSAPAARPAARPALRRSTTTRTLPGGSRTTGGLRSGSTGWRR